MKTKKVFNAKSQKVEEAVVTIDVNGEFLFTFDDGSFFKLPGHLDKEGVAEALKSHEEANKGQVSLAVLEKENAEKLKNI